MKSKKELARELTKVAQVAYFQRGAFTFAHVNVQYEGRYHSAYDFAKCALSFDEYNPDLGMRIAVNRCLSRIAEVHRLGNLCFERFEQGWVGETDYGEIYSQEGEECQ